MLNEDINEISKSTFNALEKEFLAEEHFLNLYVEGIHIFKIISVDDPYNEKQKYTLDKARGLIRQVEEIKQRSGKMFKDESLIVEEKIQKRKAKIQVIYWDEEHAYLTGKICYVMLSEKVWRKIIQYAVNLKALGLNHGINLVYWKSGRMKVMFCFIEDKDIDITKRWIERIPPSKHLYSRDYFIAFLKAFPWGGYGTWFEKTKLKLFYASDHMIREPPSLEELMKGDPNEVMREPVQIIK